MLSVPRVHGHKQTTTPLADSGISDRLVKLRPLVDQTCFELTNFRYVVVCYFQRRMCNTTKLICMAPSVELMTQM